jgi:ATP-dependent RNA helicase SUPV3L1/SUV3
MQRYYSSASGASSARVVAVLGPTNTGKTYLALERMLGHGSGMMGFPLRLLARENYDRAVAIKGPRQVALITGEEKIVPAYAKYFFCTVESMPVEKRLAFVAVDEIQLAADPDRGHIFTERLLTARGEEETMFMGSDTVRPLIRRLVPEASYISRPRFSELSFTGTKKILRLPPRSAVVGFSAQDVYTIAELIRRERGGAAVVMGALSPRTRNAQVAMFQNGEVDYLVATDAIGMGLNMDVDHIAFARLAKFDGSFHRDLRPDELAQIAGRAGRHMSDGSFGLTGGAGTRDHRTHRNP